LALGSQTQLRKPRFSHSLLWELQPG
jgi:hypothetical protein